MDGAIFENDAILQTRNKCYTYFKIVGNFKTDEISEMLGLTPDEKWDIGDFRRNGTQYDFANWKIGSCDEYDILIENQMRKTIAPLLDKIDILKQIHKNYKVDFVLEIVPSICVGDINPCLGPPLDIIDFCHETRTEIDIDMYVMEAADE